MALVGRRPRGLLVGGVGLRRHPVGRRSVDRPGKRLDARCRVVPRRQAQLRRDHAADAGAGRRRRGRGRAFAVARRGAHHRCRAPRPGGPGPQGPRALRHRTGRPCRRVRTEHPRDTGADAGHRQPGGRVQLVRTGVRRAERHRPLAADRAEAAPRGRRLRVRRQGDQPPRRGGGHPGQAPERPHRRLAALPGRPRDLHRRGKDLGRPRLRTSAAGVRAGALRGAAVRAVLVGHHRTAEADRARARRHHDRAPQGAQAFRATSGPRTASSGFPRPAG